MLTVNYVGISGMARLSSNSVVYLALFVIFCRNCLDNKLQHRIGTIDDVDSIDKI